MSFQSTDVWARGWSYAWEAIFGVVVFCGFMVIISLVHNIVKIVRKQQVFVVNKLSLAFFIGMPLVIMALLISEFWWRIDAFYGVSTFYVSYWWHYLLFSAANYVVILGAWIIKNLYTKGFAAYKKELLGIKDSMFMCFQKMHQSLRASLHKLARFIWQVPKFSKQTVQRLFHAIMKLFTKKVKVQDVITSPIKGRIVALAQVNDKAFAEAHLGQGFAVIPPLEADTFVAPLAGTVVTIFHTNHAYGIKSAQGTHALVHVGLNTVQLQGKHFQALQKVGAQVQAGTPVIKANLKKIHAAGYDVTTLVVCTPETIGTITMDTKQIDKQVGLATPIMKIS